MINRITLHHQAPHSWGFLFLRGCVDLDKELDMKKILLIALLLVVGCESNKIKNKEKSASVQKIDKSIDVCRCLTEPGNSKYMQENGDACREAISKEIGVDNWEKVNFSKNAELSARFDALVTKCQ